LSRLPQLVHILDGAYRNALLHDSARQNLESSDLLLENASIDFSVRVLNSIKSEACNSGTDATDESACSLDDPSLSLGDWTEMISYAAYRLENLSHRTATKPGANSSQAIVGARIESMEHLYRRYSPSRRFTSIILKPERISMRRRNSYIWLASRSRRIGHYVSAILRALHHASTQCPNSMVS